MTQCTPARANALHAKVKPRFPVQVSFAVSNLVHWICLIVSLSKAYLAQSRVLSQGLACVLRCAAVASISKLRGAERAEQAHRLSPMVDRILCAAGATVGILNGLWEVAKEIRKTRHEANDKFSKQLVAPCPGPPT